MGVCRCAAGPAADSAARPAPPCTAPARRRAPPPRRHEGPPRQHAINHHAGSSRWIALLRQPRAQPRAKAPAPTPRPAGRVLRLALLAGTGPGSAKWPPMGAPLFLLTTLAHILNTLALMPCPALPAERRVKKLPCAALQPCSTAGAPPGPAALSMSATEAARPSPPPLSPARPAAAHGSQAKLNFACSSSRTAAPCFACPCMACPWPARGLPRPTRGLSSKLPELANSPRRVRAGAATGSKTA